LIAVDSSSWIALWRGDEGPDIVALEQAIFAGVAVLAPVVQSELFSDPQLPAAQHEVLSQLPLLELCEGYWKRAGLLRAKLRAEGRKARLADVLIAQACLDHDIPLITRDRDFKSLAAKIDKLQLIL